MTISANTLFHFTRDYDTLLKILRTKFFPRLCLEQSVMTGLSLRFAVPMVCFCDIPLSQIAEHTSKYGRYAIGIKKRWAIQQGVAPVLYVHENSLIPQTFYAEIKEIASINADPKKIDQVKMMRYIDAVCMMKQYKGIDVRLNKEICFYDEREWRYVPRRMDNNQVCYLIEDFFKQEKIRREIDRKNEQFGLSFTPDSINYLIVDREEEILDLKREIEKIKGAFSHNDVELLSTRILSMERIEEDM